MISSEQQSELIGRIDAAGGIIYRNFPDSNGVVHEDYLSGAGIRGNSKIELDAAAKRDPELMDNLAEAGAEELAEADVLAAVGGGVCIARAIALKAGKPYVVINSYTLGGVKNFRLYTHGLDVLGGDPAVGFVEDVSSTLRTVQKALCQTGLGQLTVKVLSCWRRGIPAPPWKSPADIDQQNRDFNYREIWEHRLGPPVTGLIERPMPLWIPRAQQIKRYLPELAGT